MWIIILLIAIVLTLIIIYFEFNPFIPSEDNNDFGLQTIIMIFIGIVALSCWAYVLLSK